MSLCEDDYRRWRLERNEAINRLLDLILAKPPPQKPNPAETWKPAETPGFEVNGLGQLRTTGHKPQQARHPIKKPEPAVTEGHVWDWADYGC